MRKIFLIAINILLLSTVSSCAFNKNFLRPTILDNDTKEQHLIIQGDQVKVEYAGENKQPLYIRNGNDTVSLSYTIESYFIESTSGNALNTWILRHKEIEPKATIVYYHGNAGDLTSRHWSMSLMLQHGFQVFAIDYSGYGLSHGKATRKNVFQDGLSALEAIAQREDVEKKPLILYGQSLGGHLSAAVSGQKAELIDALVIEGAFSSHKDIGKTFAGFLGTWFVREMYSGKKNIQDYHKPVLIIHSDEDEVVPFEMGQTLFKNANEPKEFYHIKGCHICGSRLYHEEIADKIWKMVGVDKTKENR